MKVLVTGGAGYIGSHTTLSLLEAGHEVVVLDNLRNSQAESLRRVEQLTGKTVDFREVDLLDAPAVDAVFAEGGFEAVIHFAGLKAVGESVEKPLRYYQNNVAGTLILLDSMDAAGVRRLVFSSSATVYGAPEEVPLIEKAPLDATNPYGRTKVRSRTSSPTWAPPIPRWSIALLRYFNPVGAHESGLIGEDPSGIPNNLLPFVAQVAVGRREKVMVFGNDYPTPDGTGVRDYIHVMDLAPATWPPWAPAATKRECSAGTLAPAGALPCSKSSRRSARRPATRCLTNSRPAVPATPPSVTPTLRPRSRIWAGPHTATSLRCARTTGDGKAGTRRATPRLPRPPGSRPTNVPGTGTRRTYPQSPLTPLSERPGSSEF